MRKTQESGEPAGEDRIASAVLTAASLVLFASSLWVWAVILFGK